MKLNDKTLWNVPDPPYLMDIRKVRDVPFRLLERRVGSRFCPVSGAPVHSKAACLLTSSAHFCCRCYNIPMTLFIHRLVIVKACLTGVYKGVKYALNSQPSLQFASHVLQHCS